VDRQFLKRVNTGHLTARLDAIEGLGKARLPQALDALMTETIGLLLQHDLVSLKRVAQELSAQD